MSDIDDLYTDLNADPQACAPNYESRRASLIQRTGKKRPKAPFQNASMPNRDIGGIRKFSWETE